MILILYSLDPSSSIKMVDSDGTTEELCYVVINWGEKFQSWRNEIPPRPSREGQVPIYRGTKDPDLSAPEMDFSSPQMNLERHKHSKGVGHHTKNMRM